MTDPGQSMPRSGIPFDGLTLTDATAAAAADGYGANFSPVETDEGPAIRCPACRGTCPASEMTVDRVWRVEGVSDVADESLIAAVTCPHCGEKGTLILGYGPNAGPEASAVLAALDLSGATPD